MPADDARACQVLVQLLKYAGIGSLTYLVAEYVETVEDEIALIWPSRWNMMKLIFLFNRYSPFFDHAITISGMLWITDPHRCILNWMFSIRIYVVGIWVSEVILMMRTIALWNFHKMVVATMLLLGVVMFIPTLCIMFIYVHSLVAHYPSKASLETTGCIPSTADQIGWVFYVTTLLSETVVISLTLLNQHRTYVRRHGMPLLVYTMYRDGTIFYLIIMCFSVANFCCMFTAPVAAMPLLQQVLRAVHSTLCSRVLINLRKVAAQQSDLELDDFTTSAFQFRSTHSIESTLDSG